MTPRPSWLVEMERTANRSKEYPHFVLWQNRVLALLSLVEELVQAVKANHQWHQDYDDYDGYPDSELCDANIAAIRSYQAGPGSEGGTK